MALINITEYDALAVNKVGGPIQAGQEPAIAIQSVTYNASAQSAAFNKRTRFVRISCNAEAYLVFGENPTATATTGTNVQADTPEFFGVVGGQIVAAYDGTT